jgi:hypothetical protein
MLGVAACASAAAAALKLAEPHVPS